MEMTTPAAPSSSWDAQPVSNSFCVETIGNATLYLGDCREVLPTIGKVDAIVTDPPYGIGIGQRPTKWQRRASAKPVNWDDTTNGIVSHLPDLGPCIIWGGNYYPLPESRAWLSWFKPDAPPSMGHFELAWTNLDQNTRQLSVAIGAVNSERVGHPTQKPLRLMKWCLSFLPISRVILDPFMGSGTTGVAAVQMGRTFIGVETEIAYYDIARRRIEDAQRQGDMLMKAVP